MKRLSKWFYLGSIVCGLVAGIILLFSALVLLVLSGILTDYAINLHYAGTSAIITCSLLLLTGCAAVLYACSIWALLLYKAWAIIQDGNATTTPEKAVGFVFIPFYQLYWIFKAWYGFARDCNSYTARHLIKAPKMKEGHFLAFCILFVCINVPYVAYLAGIPFIVMIAITSSQTIKAVNALLTR